MLTLTGPCEGFGDIQRGLQALNPDAMDPRGSGGPNSLPLFFSQASDAKSVAKRRVFDQKRFQVFGLVAQGIERPPPKRQVDGSNPSGVTRLFPSIRLRSNPKLWLGREILGK